MLVLPLPSRDALALVTEENTPHWVSIFTSLLNINRIYNTYNCQVNSCTFSIFFYPY